MSRSIMDMRRISTSRRIELACLIGAWRPGFHRIEFETEEKKLFLFFVAEPEGERE